MANPMQAPSFRLEATAGGNLSIVSSTLQLLSIAEWVLSFGQGQSTDLIIANSGHGTQRLLRYARERFRDVFRDIIFLDEHAQAQYSHVIGRLQTVQRRKVFLSRLLQHRQYRRLLFGHSGPALFLMGFVVRNTGLTPVLVDDGTKTLNYLTDPEYYNYWNGLGTRWLDKNKLYSLAYGADGSFQRHARFFSTYAPFASNQVGGLQVNDYSAVKRRFGFIGADVGSEIHLLGTPELGLLDSKVLQRVISFITASIGRAVRYFPHPREPITALANIARHGFSIENEDSSYESTYLGWSLKPQVVASFHSSALPVLSHLKEESTRLVAFHLPKSIRNADESTKLVSDLFQHSFGVEIVPGDPSTG